MSVEVKVPQLPESVTDATLVNWHKSPGDSVARDENLVDLETDKVVLEVPSPVAGVLQETKVDEGAVDVWDRPVGSDGTRGILALQWGVAVRDGWSDGFHDFHLAL